MTSFIHLICSNWNGKRNKQCSTIATRAAQHEVDRPRPPIPAGAALDGQPSAYARPTQRSAAYSPLCHMRRTTVHLISPCAAFDRPSSADARACPARRIPFAPEPHVRLCRIFCVPRAVHCCDEYRSFHIPRKAVSPMSASGHPPRLLDRVRDALRRKHSSLRTEEA